MTVLAAVSMISGPFAQYGVLGIAAAADASIDLGLFAQYGVLGIIATMLIWFARGAHQRERDRADRIEEDNKKLNMIILDRVIPALTSATRAIEECTELLSDLQRERRETYQDRHQPERRPRRDEP